MKVETIHTPSSSLRQRLARLYFGQDTAAIRFQFALMVIDLAIIAFFLAGSYLRNRPSYWSSII